MKIKILNIFLVLLFCVNSMVYAIMAKHSLGYYIIDEINYIMSVVISVIIVYFLIKIFKSNEKKKWIIWFINILSVALIFKWGAYFWVY